MAFLGRMAYRSLREPLQPARVLIFILLVWLLSNVYVCVNFLHLVLFHVL